MKDGELIRFTGFPSPAQPRPPHNNTVLTVLTVTIINTRRTVLVLYQCTVLYHQIIIRAQFLPSLSPAILG